MKRITAFITNFCLGDRLILVSLGVGFFVNIVLWATLFSKFGFGREAVPLHFNVVYGIDLVGSSRKLYQLGLIGLLILILNAILAHILYSLHKLFSYFLIFAAASAQVLLLVAGLALTTLHA